MKKTFTPLMIFGLIWLGIVLLSWFLFPGWSQFPGGFFTLAGLTAVGVIAFLKDGYSFIKDLIESRRIIDADTQQIDNHDLYADNDSQITNIRWSERDQNLVSKYVDLCCSIDPKFAENKTEARFLQYCVSIGLARNVGGSTFLTQAGVLLFCKKQFFPHTKYHIDVTFKDSENDLSNEFSAPILESYFSILELLSPLTTEWRDPTKRKKTGQERVFFFYPKTAIIEALVNFFIHRDYKKDDIGYITIYSDRIEFENPGQSLYPIDELIKATHPLKPQYKRNPRLIQAFRITGLNQREGRGVIRIKQELENNGSTRKDGTLGLHIENDAPSDRFRLVIYKKSSPAALTQREQIAAAVEKSVTVIQPSLHQLPPAPSDFTGRHKEIDEILAGFKENKVSLISGLVGMGGIGKTVLGLVVAHRLVDQYPDAQIFLDLRGTTNPLSHQDIVRHVILSIEPNADLRNLDEAGMLAVYQSILHGKRALLFLDNARSSEQIVRILPPSTCTMIVTSRFAFSLPGLKVFRLDILDEKDAVQFLLTLCPRLGDNAKELAKACGFLPLALRIAGSFLETNQDWQVAKYLAQLIDRKQRLSTLESSHKEAELTNDYDLISTFELSYQQLGHNEQLHWQELAVFGPSFSLNAAAYVSNLEETEMQKLLGTFQRYAVIDFNPKTSRYSMHELLSEFALRQTTESEVHGAQFLHARYYLQVLEQANRFYLQGGEGVLRGLELFDRERENIQKGQEWAARNSTKTKEVAEICAAYPSAGADCLELRLHPNQRIIWLESSLKAYQFIGKREGEGISLGNLGNAYAALGELRKAIEFYERALTIDREIGDRRGEGADLHNLGLAYADLGEFRKALELYERALVNSRELGDRRGEGAILGNLGNIYADLGENRKALEYYEKRLRIAREIGDHRGEGNALGNLGLSYANLGDVRKAIEFYEQALLNNRQIADRRGEATSLGNLGNAYSILGDVRRAIEFYEQTLVINREIGNRRGEGTALGNLGLAHVDLGEARKAIELYERALDIAGEIGDRLGTGNALGNLGLAYSKLGNVSKAIDFFRQALVIHQEIGDRNGVGNALGNLGSAYKALGDTHAAIQFFEQALEINQESGDIRGVGIGLANLGSAFANLGDLEKAMHYTKEALSIFEKIESPYTQQMRTRLAGLSGEISELDQNKPATAEGLVRDVFPTLRMNRPLETKYFDVVTKMASDPFARYKIGQRITGKIKRIIPVGLIVELEPGVSGLVHTSQIGYDFMIPEKIEERFKIGEEVTALIIGVETDKRRISLSIKQA